ncbi:MAG: hypothetical protein ACD_67C00242G0001 [uncultured bacterium]|nr:MAG: hypothetical protein ACD_67C00242G0001 [uncultured bacterium]
MINSKNKAFLREWKSKKLFIVAVVLMLAIGVFLRAYNFADWQHFELDQSRDAKVIDLAVENGAGDLPLLGPKAAGSFLRLGPIFYYFGFVSAKIFGNTPQGIAVISLIFSCLTLPLFYLFARRFFTQKISLMLLAVFSSSFFLVMYSRFAWNPNTLPFFILAGVYGLLRATDLQEKRRGWWLVLASFMFAIASQLHFVAFLGLPIIASAYLIVKRPRINWKYWLASLFCIIFLYVPPIINDIKTGGQNIQEFEKVFAKKTKKDDHNMIEKVIRDFDKNSIGYVLLLSGQQEAELPKIRIGGQTNIDFSCDDDCKSAIPLGVLAVAFFLLGIVLLAYNLFDSFAKKNLARMDFTLLTCLWFFGSLVLFAPIAYDFVPRFLLLVAPLPFVFLGFVLEFLEKKKMGWIVWLLVFILVISNVWSVSNRFSQMSKAPFENVVTEPDRILKEHDRVTLEQQLLITDYFENIYRQNNYPVYVNSEAFYRRAFLYHLEKRSIVRDDFRNTRNVYAEGNFFLVYPTSMALEKITDDYVEKYDVASVKEFGTLKVVRLTPKPEMITAVRQEFGPAKKPTSSLGVPVRCRWNEVLGNCNTDGTEESSDDEAGIE